MSITLSPPASPVAGIVIDRRARVVEANGQRLELSAKEYALLIALVHDPYRVLTKSDLLRDVWGYANHRQVTTRTVDSHACRLRRKLTLAGLPGLVENVWGVGYRMTSPPSLS